MARLHIADRSSIVGSGNFVNKVASQAAAQGVTSLSFVDGVGGPTELAQRFNSLFTNEVVCDESVEASEAQAIRAEAFIPRLTGDDPVYVQFHFDRTVYKGGEKAYRIVNVVIPDFTTKLVRDEDGNPKHDEDGDPISDLTSIAEECFGMEVFAKCE